MLRIYEKDLTAANLATALATNGLGTLPHALSCTRHQVINGDWSLTLSYPLDAPGAALLQPERLLCYEDEGGAQLYRISRLKPSISRQGRTLEVEAPHLCYDLAHKYIVNIETSEDDRYPDGIDAATALEQLLAGTGFSPGDVTAGGDTLDYLDILQKDVMSCIKEQLLEKWGGELEFDNFTVHLRSALGQDRRYPIRDGRNIAGITVTEDYEPVVTRLHVRGYENANFEEINDGKDWIDSELSAQYAYAREGYADFDDVDDPQELLRLGRERLTALEVPEITYDIRLAQMRGTVQYAAYRRLENFALGDTAVLHSAAVDRDVILRCSELETDCLSGRNKSLKLGNTDVKLLASITAGASANDRLAHVLDTEGNVQAEKIAGKLNLVRIENLTAEIARIATAAIGEATIEAAQIHDLQAQVAKIVTVSIRDAHINSAQIDDLAAVVAEMLHAEIKVGEFDLAEVKNLLSEALALEQGTAGSMYITNLAVTSANLLSAMLGKLVLKGQDGKYYQVMVGADGTIHTKEVQPSQGEIEAGETESGQGIVDTSANFADLTAQNIKGNEGIFQTILAQSMTAGKLTAGEAMIASATIPTLYATSIQAIGNSLDLSANESISLIVGGNVQALEGLIYDAQEQLGDIESALGNKADQETVLRLSTELTQTAQGITAVINRVEAVEGENAEVGEILAAYQLTFRMDADGVTIGKSNSGFDVRIDNEKLSFRETGQEIAYVSNSQLFITAAEITQSLTIGNYRFSRMEDGSLALLM
jgi:phage minor structural protein